MKKSFVPFVVVVVVIAIFALNRQMQKKPAETTPKTGSSAASEPALEESTAPVVAAVKKMTFKKGRLLKDGENVLTVGLTASPDVVDWNNDGKKDLLVGTFHSGAVYLFLNQGTDAAPVFKGSSRIIAGEAALKVGYG